MKQVRLHAPLLTCLSLLACAALAPAQEETLPVSARDAALQANFAKFQQFELKKTAKGSPKRQTLTFNKNAVEIEGDRYDGIRFKVTRSGPETEKKLQHLAWAFVPPPNLHSWYIVAKSGKMTGFANFYTVGKDELPKFVSAKPDEAADLYLQNLDGEHLEEGQEYLIFFRFTDDKPVEMSLALGFATLKEVSAPTIALAVGGDETE